MHPFLFASVSDHPIRKADVLKNSYKTISWRENETIETEKMFGSFSPVRKETNLLGWKRAEAPCSRALWQFQAYEIGVPKNPRKAYKFVENRLFSFSASLALIQRRIGRRYSLETLDLPGLVRFVSDNPASSRRLPHQCQSCHLLTTCLLFKMLSTGPRESVADTLFAAAIS